VYQRCTEVSRERTCGHRMVAMIILLVFVGRSPVGVPWPDVAHPGPTGQGITTSFAKEQPLRHDLRRWLPDGSGNHLARPGYRRRSLRYTGDRYLVYDSIPLGTVWLGPVPRL